MIGKERCSYMAWSARTLASVATADVPTTTADMSALMEWEQGDEVYGTFAKTRPGPKSYVRDIKRAKGKDKQYKDIYIDTFMPVADQLLKFKKKR